MLSNETTPNLQPIENYVGELAKMKAANLAARLIQREVNPSPKELPNPSAPGATRVRRIVLVPEHCDVTPECADHNSRVASLGAVSQWEHTWKGRG